MWIEDKDGNLHNSAHLVRIYKLVNTVDVYGYVKATDILGDTYILSVHTTVTGAEVRVRELQTQLDKEVKLGRSIKS